MALGAGTRGSWIFGGCWTLLMILMSAQFRNISWSPQPIIPVPLAQIPQVFPEKKSHLNFRAKNRQNCNFDYFWWENSGYKLEKVIFLARKIQTCSVSPLEDALGANHIIRQLDFVLKSVFFLWILGNKKLGWILIGQVQWMLVHTLVIFQAQLVIDWTEFHFEPSPMIGCQFDFDFNHLSLNIGSCNCSGSKVASILVFSRSFEAPIISTNSTFSIIFLELNWKMIISFLLYRIPSPFSRFFSSPWKKNPPKCDFSSLLLAFSVPNYAKAGRKIPFSIPHYIFFPHYLHN